jgi:DNA adenine methylase
MAIRSYMGYGNKGASGRIRTGFSTSPRDKSSGNLRFDIESWNRYPESLLNVAKRLKNTLIENTDAIELMRKYDSPEALFYCDPPYLRSLRGTPNVYKFEMLEKDHRRLLEFLTECKAMVILSGYAGDLYNGFLSDWEQVTKGTHTVNAGDRIETLWISPNAVRIQKLFSYKECCQ